MATDTELAPRRALELSLRTTQNPYYTRHLGQMKQTLASGGAITEAFRRPGVFPIDFLDMLSTGEETGMISEAMGRVAEQYEEKAKMFFRMFSILAGVAVFIMVACLMIAMIFAFAMQYVNMLNEATQF